MFHYIDWICNFACDVYFEAPETIMIFSNNQLLTKPLSKQYYLLLVNEYSF